MLSHYRGELVAELALPQCEGFSRWLSQARSDWRERVIDYAERALSQAQMQPEALLRALLARFPEHVAFQEQLIRCLAGHGQVTAARERFHALLRQLALSGEQPSRGSCSSPVTGRILPRRRRSRCQHRHLPSRQRVTRRRRSTFARWRSWRSHSSRRKAATTSVRRWPV
ncbi:bacterial transcriptional activator domain-containing protein [Salinicola tamaricis]|uniref:bacterial transcriptional activator domain-containing protein n=1 Tax=Salinicola tamaricis TaxID=1771309 RepID=UPI001F5CBBB5|nr:bacterial transcriptional activator domain-containing protein [Salinicola tamaricis]